MKNHILYGIIILILLFAGVYLYQTTKEKQRADTQQSQQNQADRILEIRLEVNAPFSTAKLLVDNQGTISYEASAPDARIDKQLDSIKITKQQFIDLADLVIKNNFWSFKEQYFEESLMDATTYTISVKSLPPNQYELIGAKIYSVSCYGDCPEEIIEIINKIKELWGKKILEVGV